ncbi:MAG: molecular chaperone DnaK [Myxococcales bacterium]|nr:molecular chaperone DnaK [Myxococcales bacterium]
MEVVVGIDLGTTNSCVAIVENNVPTVLANKGGFRTTPSIVAAGGGGRRLVGHIAKRQAVTNAAQTIYAAKRLIGRKWTAPETQKMAQAVPYSLAQGPRGDVRVRLQERVHSVPEISAHILREMKLIAERHTGGAVERAVITVPAYFNDNQRQATRDAARIAGLEVIRMINEPTAAALAYGFGKRLERKVAVYDLGGGTFDVTILEISRGVFHVKSTAGDSFLGGEDFDLRLVDYLVGTFEDVTGFELTDNRMALQRIKDTAEKARCELSATKETLIDLPFLHETPDGEVHHLQENMTVRQLEDLTEDLVERTIDICKQALVEAELTVDQLDDVVLVGGMTRMPLIQRRVAEFFGRPPSKRVHPDEVVALGAAIQAAALVSDAEEVLLLDVTSHSLGIMVKGGRFHRLIDKNTTIPTEAGHVFTTTLDHQTLVKILVLQGESDKAAENELLGEFMLSGLRDARAGVIQVEVTVSISADGIVSVGARDLETGAHQRIQVTASSGLSEDEIEDLAQESRDYLVEARRSPQFEQLCQRTRKLAGGVRALLPEVDDVMNESRFGREAVAKARAVIDRAEPEIERGDARTVEAIAQTLERTLGMFQLVMQRRSPPSPRV